MRLYDFECLHCGQPYEELVRSSETGENVRCPECGEIGARKLINGFSVGRAGGAGGGSAFSTSGGGCGSGGFS